MPWRHSRRLGAVLLVTVVLTTGLLRGGRYTDPDVVRVAELIRQLGDSEFARREAASRELEELAEKALFAVQQAAVSHKDPEIRRRARESARLILLGIGKSKSLEMRLVAIHPGDFFMGSPVNETGRRSDETLHEVKLTQLFLLGSHEVSQQDYEEIMGVNPSGFQVKAVGRNRIAGTNPRRLPVEQVTWYDAIEFCNRLSRRDGHEPYYTLSDAVRERDSIKIANVSIVGGNGYRLPTEAEWEYACRASTTTAYHFGKETRQGVTNCKPMLVSSGYGSSYKWQDLSRTTEVGTYPANPFGLFDMHGNVAEWCWDWYDRDYYERSPKVDPTGPAEGTHRALRGGSWLVSEASCRSASRFFHAPQEVKDYVGFRVARTPGARRPR